MNKQLITRAVAALLAIISISLSVSSCRFLNRQKIEEEYYDEECYGEENILEKTLEQVVPGMTEDEVNNIMGKPRDRQYDYYTGAVRLYYGNYMVVIRNGVVHHWVKMYDL